MKVQAVLNYSTVPKSQLPRKLVVPCPLSNVQCLCYVLISRSLFSLHSATQHSSQHSKQYKPSTQQHLHLHTAQLHTAHCRDKYTSYNTYTLYLIMSPLRLHIFVCFMAKSAFWRVFWALAPYTGVGPI